jgi:hypothetical protein
VPLKCLPGYGCDAFEVAVAMEQGQALQFGGGGHQKVHRSGAAVLSALGECLLDLPRSVVGAVIDRYPSAQQSHVLDALDAVRGGSCIAAESELGDRADRDQPGCCRAAGRSRPGLERRWTSEAVYSGLAMIVWGGARIRVLRGLVPQQQWGETAMGAWVRLNAGPADHWAHG